MLVLQLVQLSVFGDATPHSICLHGSQNVGMNDVYISVLEKQMAQKKVTKKRKHVPHRICIACREAAGKRGLIRIVRTADGVVVDLGGKLPGRGAYLHSRIDCWRIALETNLIGRALRTRVSAEATQKLKQFSTTLVETVMASDNA